MEGFYVLSPGCIHQSHARYAETRESDGRAGGRGRNGVGKTVGKTSICYDSLSFSTGADDELNRSELGYL